MGRAIKFKNETYVCPYFPIGSIYLSVVDTDPSNWFGGTWEQIAKGRTLVGVDVDDTDFNTVEKTGGEKAHKLTEQELAPHKHILGQRIMVWDAGDYNGSSANYQSPIRYYDWNKCSTELTGEGKEHNNVQPYFTCYIWCRIA